MQTLPLIGMKLVRLFLIVSAGGVLAADLAEPGYGRFGWQKLTNPASHTIARAWSRSQPALQPVAATIGIEINGRDKGCKDISKQYQGFSAEQWQQFKKAGKGQNAAVAVANLGGVFCQLPDGSLRFLPSFAGDKTLDIQVKNGKVDNAKLSKI